MKKRVLVVIACICIVLGTAGTAVAAPGDVGIAPMWTNASTITLDMSLSNGTMTSVGTVTGKAGTTAIFVTFTLEKLVNGKYVPVGDPWTASSSSMILSSSHKTSNCTSGTYRLTISGTVTKDGYAEPINDWFTKTL